MRHTLNLYFGKKALQYRFDPASFRYRFFSKLVRLTDEK